MHAIGSRRINIEAILRLVILLGFAIFFFSIIQSGKVELYVHPRIVPYIKFGIIAMISISLFTIRDIFKPKRKVNVVPYLFFIIPLFLAFSLPAKSIDSTSMSFGDMKIVQQAKGTTSDNNSVDTTDNSSPGDGTAGTDNNLNADTSASSNANNGSNSDSLASAEPDPDQMDRGLKLQDDTVVMDDNNFVKWLQEIYDKMGTYQGKKIQVTGFVFKDKQFKENEFVPARLMMTCCTADLQPVGFLCRYDKATELKHDTWIKVTGTIKIVDYKGQKTPVIVAESVVSAYKPKNEYVYPY